MLPPMIVVTITTAGDRSTVYDAWAQHVVVHLLPHDEEEQHDQRGAGRVRERDQDGGGGPEVRADDRYQAGDTGPHGEWEPQLHSQKDQHDARDDRRESREDELPTRPPDAPGDRPEEAV